MSAVPARLALAHREFPDFDLAYLPPMPGDWTDTSWRNDTCPSWRAAPAELPTGGEGCVLVFVDYHSPSAREFPDAPRYSARLERVASMRPFVLEADELVATDDWDELLAAVRAAVEGLGA